MSDEHFEYEEANVEDEQPRGKRRRQNWHGPNSRLKSPFGAALLSCMPGMGQVYLGYYRRGFTHLFIVAMVITIIAGGSIDGLEPLFGLFLAFFWIYNMIDAARRASALNRAIETGEVSEELLLPDEGAGRGVGIALIVAGSLLLLYTRFDLDMRWLREWWPLGLILVGANITYNAFQKSE